MRWQFKDTLNELNSQYLHKKCAYEWCQAITKLSRLCFLYSVPEHFVLFCCTFLCVSALMGLSVCGSLFILSPETSPWFHFLQPVGQAHHSSLYPIPQHPCTHAQALRTHAQALAHLSSYPLPTGEEFGYLGAKKIIFTIPFELNATCKQKEVAGRT